METDAWEHISAPLARVIEKSAEAMRERQRERDELAKREKLCAEVLDR